MSSLPATSVQTNPPLRGHVFWLFGLSGAGKTTLAGLLSAQLRQSARGVLLLDGDRLRHGLSEGLGFSETDRTENLRRAAEVARLGVESGLVVVAAFITPLESQRRRIGGIIGPGVVSFVWVDASLETCRRRDAKGLYAQAAAGLVKDMTGLASAFEAPADAGFVVETGVESVTESARRLMEFVGRTLAARQ